MCGPIAPAMYPILAGAGLMAAGTYSQNQSQKAQANAISNANWADHQRQMGILRNTSDREAQFLAAEQARQDAFQAQRQQSLAQAMTQTMPNEGQFEAAMGEQAAARREMMNQNAPPVEMSRPAVSGESTANRVVNQSAEAARDKQSGILSGRLDAQAAMGGLGDQLMQMNLQRVPHGFQMGALNSFGEGSRGLLPFELNTVQGQRQMDLLMNQNRNRMELTNAQRKGSGRALFGDIANTIGQAMIGYGAGGGTFGGTAGAGGGSAFSFGGANANDPVLHNSLFR
jgi:hypothetical protein